MKKLPYRVQRKKKILRLYHTLLKNVHEISFFDQDLVHTTPWFIDVLAEKRDDLAAYLKENGIGSRVMYPPINQQKAYQYKGTYPVANLVGEKGLWLPSASQLTDAQIRRICKTIEAFYKIKK